MLLTGRLEDNIANRPLRQYVPPICLLHVRISDFILQSQFSADLKPPDESMA
jgi:hypothetical protein